MNNIEQLIILQSLENGSLVNDLPDIIADHQATADKLKSLWEEYSGEVPIKSRTFTDTTKANNKLVNHWRKYITDQFVGYGFGHEIGYSVAESNYQKSNYDLITNELKKFKARNKIAKLDIETANYQSVCSVSYRLAYIDKEGKERVMNLAPWEVIYIEDKTINELQLAIVYYPLEYKENGKTVYKTKVEVYDKTNVTYFIEDADSSFVMDYSEPVNPQPHMFDYVPIIRVQNNNQNKNDFEDVTTLIDAYDFTLSDAQNEWESFRLAYLKILGSSNVSPEDIEKFKQSGTILVPEGSNVDFLTKQVNDIFLENHKKTLEKNILRFSNTVDFSDDAFSGTSVSGESRKYKLQNLENTTIKKELEFRSGLQDMFKIIGSAWKKRGLNFDYEDMDFTFTRNLPVELLTSAEICTKFGVTPSKKTVLSLMPFISDVNAELEQIKLEQEESSINLDQLTFNDGSVDGNTMMSYTSGSAA